MVRPFLRKGEKKDLIYFIASRGEGYKKYLVYARSRGWPIYTEGSYKQMVQRNRQDIRLARLEVQRELKDVDNYDRKKRLDEYESSIVMIDELLSPNNSASPLHYCTECEILHVEKSDAVVKLLEQKRKFLLQIAQERGEWGKTDTEDGTATAGQLLRDIVMEKLSEAKETTILDGKVVVARNEGSLRI